MCATYSTCECNVMAAGVFEWLSRLQCKDINEDRDDCDNGGRTALMWAAEFGRTDCVRLLLDAGADKEATDVVRNLESICRRVILVVRLSCSVVYVFMCVFAESMLIMINYLA
jgi:hypothetical protein